MVSMFTNSVRAKLLGVVALLGSVAVLLTFVAWRQMGDIDRRLVYIVEHPAKAENLAAHVAIELTEVQRAEKDILLAENPEAVDLHRAAFAEHESRMFHALDELAEVCDKESLPLVDAFRAEYQEYRHTSDRTTELARQDTRAQAAHLSATESESLFAAMAEPFNALSERSEHRVNELMASLAEQVDEAGREELRRAADASLAAQRSAMLVQDLLHLLRIEKDSILTRTPEEAAHLDTQMSQTLARIETVRAQLEPLLSDEEKAQLASAAARLGEWTSLDARIRQLARTHTRNQAAILSATTGQDLYAQAEHEMEAIIEQAEAAMHAQEIAAAQHFRAAVRTLVIAAAVGILTALAISLSLIGKLVRTLRAVVERMRRVADGDLTGDPIHARSKDELGMLAEATNRMQAGLREMVHGITRGAEQVAAAATEVAASSEEMAVSTQEQRAQLTQVAAAVEEMSASVMEVSGRAGEVSRESHQAGRNATEGGDIVRRTVEEMNQIASQVESTAGAVSQLSERAEQIGEILTVINDIADQTNLLALNAAIEAARAGEHGRGFAVVADEVRKLAERTQEATRQVTSTVGEIREATGRASSLMSVSSDQVLSGVQLVHQTGRSLESIVSGSTSVASSIDSIAAAVEQQSAASTEIAQSVEIISASADEASQGANQAAVAAVELSTNAESLREMVARFRVA